MFISDQKQVYLFNSDVAERFAIVDKQDAVLIVASYNGNPVTMARYATKQEAREAFDKFVEYLIAEKLYYCFPLSAKFNEQEEIRDRRVKRKGGS